GLGTVAIGRGVLRRQGHEVALLCFGTVLHSAAEAAGILNASLADMRFVKPLDETLIRELAAGHSLLVTVEENAVAGGAGAAVSEYLARAGIVMPVLHLGLPDAFLDHAPHSHQLAEAGLDSGGILAAVRARLAELAGTRRKLGS